MSTIETVLGPIDSTQLGATYMHEHIFVLTTEVQQNYPTDWGDENTRIADAVTKLKALAAQGIKTIVDPTVIGLGRYIPRIHTVAQQVPELNIIAATGCYTYTDVPFYFYGHFPFAQTDALNVIDPLTEAFIRDIEQGIVDTGIKAGILKCAIDSQGLTPGVERIMRAVARAHLQTDIPITVHTDSLHKHGFDVQRIMVDEEGVAADRIVLGHTGDTTDMEYITQLADAGFVLGFDRFGINVEPITFETRANTLVEACKRGLAGSIVLSHDAACYFDWLDHAVLEQLPEWNYLHIGQKVLPYIRSQGVTQEQIDTMLIDVPRQFFERKRSALLA